MSESTGSGVRRTEDLQSIKTRAIVLQNADNTFPAVGSVLAVSDARGHVIPTQNLNVNSVAINNDRAIIDASGDIVANSITLDSSGTAIDTGGDVYVNDANIYVSGNQNTTGAVQTTYVTLLDLSANDPDTYLYANAGSLFWQDDALAQNFNISQGIQSLSVDPNYRDFVLVQSNTDPNLYLQVNRILDLFTAKQVFLNLAGTGPTPPPPVVNPLSAYNVIFNSRCGVIIRVIDSLGAPVPGIGDFRFYGNANYGSAQYTIQNLCNNLTRTTNTTGSNLSDYLTFEYSSAGANPYSVTMTALSPSYFVIFLDIEQVGEAKRFMNHLLITNQTGAASNYPYGPPFSTQLVIPPTYTFNVGQYIAYAVDGITVGRPMTNLLKYPNDDAPLTSPTFTIVTDVCGGVITVNVSAPPVLTGLTAPNAQQPGSGNTLQSYGVYVNQRALWLQPYTGPVMSFVVTITGVFLFPVNQNTLSVTSIDVYNETMDPSFVRF
jgi:hypothetical protein